VGLPQGASLKILSIDFKAADLDAKDLVPVVNLFAIEG
jgi:hypothetical protein